MQTTPPPFLGCGQRQGRGSSGSSPPLLAPPRAMLAAGRRRPGYPHSNPFPPRPSVTSAVPPASVGPPLAALTSCSLYTPVRFPALTQCGYRASDFRRPRLCCCRRLSPTTPTSSPPWKQERWGIGQVDGWSDRAEDAAGVATGLNNRALEPQRKWKWPGIFSLQLMMGGWGEKGSVSVPTGEKKRPRH